MDATRMENIGLSYPEDAGLIKRILEEEADSSERLKTAGVFQKNYERFFSWARDCSPERSQDCVTCLNLAAIEVDFFVRENKKAVTASVVAAAVSAVALFFFCVK